MEDEKQELTDPFGSPVEFLFFMGDNDGSLASLQLLNGSIMGRRYLNAYAKTMAQRANYSNLSSANLYFCIRWGGAYELKMRECGEANIDFPKVGFNQDFIDWLVSLDPQKPFQQYTGAILMVYTGYFALKAMHLLDHPYLGKKIVQIITLLPRSKHYRELWAQLCPDIPIPDTQEALKAFTKDVKEIYGYKLEEQFLHADDIVAESPTDSRPITDLMKEVFDLNYDLLRKEVDKETGLIGLIDAGLKDKLRAYSAQALKRDLIDKRRRSIKTTRESILDAKRQESADSEIDEPFLDTLPGPDLGRSEDEIDYEELGQRIERAIKDAKLTRTQNFVFRLKAESNLDYEEIAKQLYAQNGKVIRPETVRKHYSDARKRIREAYQDK